MPQFDLEKLKVYQKSIHFAAWADDLLESNRNTASREAYRKTTELYKRWATEGK